MGNHTIVASAYITVELWSSQERNAIGGGALISGMPCMVVDVWP